MSKVILVKANKGGVGKSWLTLQLAHATALRNKKVLIIPILISKSFHYKKDIK